MRHSDKSQDEARDHVRDEARDGHDAETDASRWAQDALWTAPHRRRQRRAVDEIERARRRAYVAPIFEYCARRDMVAIRIARRAAARAEGGAPFSRMRLAHIKRGRTPTPTWFIPEMCREIGEPLEVIMGAEWAQRHLPLPYGADLPTSAPGACGDAEDAPSDMDSAPHTRHPQDAERRAS